MKRIAILSLLLALGLVFVQPLQADTLISFTDNPLTSLSAGLYDFQAWHGSWTQTKPSVNTSVGAIIDGPGTCKAWLMNQVGPGTTSFYNEIASVEFTPPIDLSASQYFDLSSVPYTPLFTGLSLAPGTYYLVFLGPHSGTAWLGDYDVTVNTAAGFTVGAYAVVNQLNGILDSSYIPASTFVINSVPNQYPFYRVEGSPVPVPATLLLLGSGLLGLGGWRRFRKS
jgi:hypothetical protein